jgi:hypothetical protein
MLTDKRFKTIDEEIEKNKFKLDVLWQQLPEMKQTI